PGDNVSGTRNGVVFVIVLLLVIVIETHGARAEASERAGRGDHDHEHDYDYEHDYDWGAWLLGWKAGGVWSEGGDAAPSLQWARRRTQSLRLAMFTSFASRFRRITGIRAL